MIEQESKKNKDAAGARNHPHITQSSHFKPGHKAVARTLVYALTVGDADSFAALSDVIAMRLHREECVGVAWAANKALEADDADRLFDCAGAGMPGLPMDDKIEEAAFWADMAEPAELRAYCLASFKRMLPQDQADFLTHILERRAA